MNTPLAIARSGRGTVNLPGVEGVDLSWRDNVPLYSAVGVYGVSTGAVLPTELAPFSYAIGGTISNNFVSPVASATTATNYHTNMRVPRQLPAPEVYVMDRIRVVLMPALLVAGTSSEVSIDDVSGATGDAGLSSSNSNDLLWLQTLSLRLEIEQKVYADAPLWMFPANVGVFGAANSTQSRYAAVGPSSNIRHNVALHWAGEGWRFNDSLPPVLTSSTVLDCRIRNDHPAITGTAGNGLLAARYLFTVLHGRHGRAVR